jgi:hypothetical protein
MGELGILQCILEQKQIFVQIHVCQSDLFIHQLTSNLFVILWPSGNGNLNPGVQVHSTKQILDEIEEKMELSHNILSVKTKCFETQKNP